jgi:hypothetical protein
MQRISRKAAITVAVVALLSVPIGTMIARAHTQTFKTNLTLHVDKKSDTFVGHLGTSSFCQQGRQVTVHVAGSNAIVGSTISGHAGQWSGVSVPGPGSYFATVSQTSSGGYSGDHTCLAATSNTVTVG